ncbi:hypothetical protein HY629_02785 [Candidatus Uhrbacteria bacterium]|nr:hypothetical protein [Candidatus Uhrbacteria bacterium]
MATCVLPWSVIFSLFTAFMLLHSQSVFSRTLLFTRSSSFSSFLFPFAGTLMGITEHYSRNADLSVTALIKPEMQAVLPAIGLPQGKMQGPTYEFLKKAGIHLPEYDPAVGSRNYQIDTKHALFFMDRPGDLVTRVSMGELDAAITGSDTVVEFGAEYEEARRLGTNTVWMPPDYIRSVDLPRYREWRLVMVVRNDLQDPDFASMLRRLSRRDMMYGIYSWTEFPYTELKLLRGTDGLSVGVFPHSEGDIMIFPSRGTTESKLRRGGSMFGLEIVSTGQSLEANGLREFRETAKPYGPIMIMPKEGANAFVEDLCGNMLDIRVEQK